MMKSPKPFAQIKLKDCLKYYFGYLTIGPFGLSAKREVFLLHFRLGPLTTSISLKLVVHLQDNQTTNCVGLTGRRRGALVPREPQHRRRRRRSRVGVHPRRRRDVVGQEGRRHGRLCVEVRHPRRRHRHVVVVEAVLRREARRRLHVPLRVDVGRDGGDGRRRRPVLRVPQAQQLLDGEGRPLRHRLRRLVQYARRRDVYRAL